MVWVILIILELCAIYVFFLLLRKDKETPWHTSLEMYDWICSYFGGQGVYVWLEKEFGPARLRACAELPLISLCPHRQWNKIISRQKDVGPLLINKDHNLSVWYRKSNCEWVTVGWTAMVCCLPEIPALVLLATTKSQAQHCFKRK